MHFLQILLQKLQMTEKALLYHYYFTEIFIKHVISNNNNNNNNNVLYFHCTFKNKSPHSALTDPADI